MMVFGVYMSNDVCFSEFELSMIKLVCMCYQTVLHNHSSGFIKLFSFEAYQKYDSCINDILSKLDFVSMGDVGTH